MVAVKKDKINGDALGTGRRKSSVARVRVRAGSGKITVNSKPLEEYFVNEQHQNAVTSTLGAVEHSDSVDVLVRVNGGGMTGQSGAVRMGLARALVSYNESLHESLRDGGFLTRDSRMKERKKPGLRGARRGVQFSKR
jgi:small subunit ribosomal protein S9